MGAPPAPISTRPAPARSSIDEIYARVHTIGVRGEAERLRLAAVELAVEYERLAGRGLDREIVRLDCGAVVRAWEQLRGDRSEAAIPP